MTIPVSGAIYLSRVRQEFVTFAALLGVAPPANAPITSRGLVAYLLNLQPSVLAPSEGLQIRNADASTFIALFKDNSGNIIAPNTWRNGGSAGAGINMYDDLGLWRGMYLVWRRWNGSAYYDGATTV